MREKGLLIFGFLVGCLVFAGAARAQAAPGALEFRAHITPTAARPEPVRQFTFYLLTKSYTQIVKEAEEKDPAPDRNAFIDSLQGSGELRDWLKAHDTLDLASPDIDKLLSADDILGVPEFLAAYQRSNSGGATMGFPRPKYSEADRTKRPEKYEKLRQDYLKALMKYLHAHPESVTTIELEFQDSNPQRKWDALLSARRKRVLRTAPDLAQLKFLAAKAETDLEGHAFLSGLPPADYWLSTLNLDASAGDMRVHWDVPVRIETGQTTRLELSNLNSVEASGSHP